MLLSMALGWWLRGAVVKGEIASLEKTNDTLKQRLELAQEKEAASKPALVEINALPPIEWPTST